MAGKPLVSFVLLAYKQERFIREAVQSALAQTYEPLEIVLSDDCSPDLTFEIMKEEARSYGGPHRVILNRNQTNLGLVGNLNRAWELSNGEFIVVQAGDDVSMPHRTEALVKAWSEPSPVDLVCSDALPIDASGSSLPQEGYLRVPPCTLEQAVAGSYCCALGATLGYSRSLVTSYGPIDIHLKSEDGVITFRALLGRGIRWLDEPLIKYRMHGGNISFGSHLRVDENGRLTSYRKALNALVVIREWIKAWDASGRPNNSDRLRLLALEQQRRYDVQCYTEDRIGAMRLAMKGLIHGLPLRKTIGLIKRHVLRP